jgi:LuxR family transcriptional regulator, transcriptional activator of the bioluminescence operon
MKNTLFMELIPSLDNVSNEIDLKAVCEKFCSSFEMEYYIFAICSVTSLSAPEVTAYSNYPEDWFKSYFEEEMQKHDPVVKYCFENTSPIRWDKLMTMSQYVDPIGAKIIQRASEFGLVNGLSIPLKAPNGKIAIFSLATANTERIDVRMNDVLPLAQNFSSLLFDTSIRLGLTQSESNDSQLTAREIECLFWACEGKTAWEISKILDVSERTIIFHLTSATKKLGAVNRQHAVAKAIISGLIKPTP